LPRPLASFVVCSITLLLLYLLGLGLYTEISGLVEDLPAYSQRINELVDNVAARADQYEKRTYELVMPKRFQEREQQIQSTEQAAGAQKQKGRKKNVPDVAPPAPNTPVVIPEVRIHSEPTPLFTYIYGYLRSFYNVLLMASFVPFLVYFMLSWRDHIYHSFLRFFDGPDRVAVSRSLEGVAEMARAFVVGNFMIGVLLATVSWAAFAIIHVPYPFLAGILSGFLSLVPYAGMVLALLPPVLSIIAGGDTGTVILIVLMIVLTLHLTAMNVLYPKIVGARVHLNPLVVTFSLMFWGFLWDAAGLLLAIPITAGIKAVCDNVAGLRSFGRFLGD
jgi:predicted PurR-regulated permease PerM